MTAFYYCAPVNPSVPLMECMGEGRTSAILRESGHPVDTGGGHPKTTVRHRGSDGVDTRTPGGVPPTIRIMGGRGSWARAVIAPRQNPDMAANLRLTASSRWGTGVAAPARPPVQLATPPVHTRTGVHL